MSHNECLPGISDQEKYSITRTDKSKEETDEGIGYHFLWGTY